MKGRIHCHFILLICLIAFCQSLSAQIELQTEWVKSYASPVGGKAQSWGVDVDSEGNIYYQANIDSLGQNYDIVGYKFDAEGNMLWDAPLYYGGPGAQQAYVCIEEGNEIYVGGRYCQFTGFSCDMLLLKVDKATGEVIWDAGHDFGNNGYDEVDGLAIEPDGIYCGGWGQTIQEGIFQNDMGLWKLNHDGTTEWTNHLGQAETSEHLDGHFVLDEDFIYGAGLWGGTNWIVNINNGHSFLGKFSRSDGTLVDSVLFGSQTDEYLDIDNALGMTSDGEFLYLTGYTMLPGGDDWQIYIAKFDFDLNQIWYENYGGSSAETARGIVTLGDRIYIAGATESEEIMTGGDQDGLLLEYDKNGTYLSHYTWGQGNRDSFRDIVIHDESIYLPGTSAPQGGGDDTLAFLVKASLGNVANSITELSTAASDLRLFFDESLGQLTIHPSTVLGSSDVEILIHDSSGRLLYNSIEKNKAYYSVELKQLPSALYLVSVKTDRYMQSARFFK